jgi:hypothetical protein
MTVETSLWCANWFIAFYCDNCYQLVEQAMRQDILADWSVMRDYSKNIFSSADWQSIEEEHALTLA